MRVLLGIVILILFNSCNNAAPTTYYLPENYEGVFAVVYSQPGRKNIVIDGRRQFHIPPNGILLTSADFKAVRDDIFLMKTEYGYDTLKMYQPYHHLLKSSEDLYTIDSNAIAVNFRQIGNFYPNRPDKCSFQYELVTIGRAATLHDSIGREFKARLRQVFDTAKCR